MKKHLQILCCLFVTGISDACPVVGGLTQRDEILRLFKKDVTLFLVLQNRRVVENAKHRIAIQNVQNHWEKAVVFHSRRTW